MLFQAFIVFAPIVAGSVSDQSAIFSGSKSRFAWTSDPWPFFHGAFASLLLLRATADGVWMDRAAPTR
jgi:hypothetical protein